MSSSIFSLKTSSPIAVEISESDEESIDLAVLPNPRNYSFLTKICPTPGRFTESQNRDGEFRALKKINSHSKQFIPGSLVGSDSAKNERKRLYNQVSQLRSGVAKLCESARLNAVLFIQHPWDPDNWTIFESPQILKNQSYMKLQTRFHNSILSPKVLIRGGERTKIRIDQLEKFNVLSVYSWLEIINNDSKIRCSICSKYSPAPTKYSKGLSGPITGKSLRDHQTSKYHTEAARRKERGEEPIFDDDETINERNSVESQSKKVRLIKSYQENSIFKF